MDIQHQNRALRAKTFAKFKEACATEGSLSEVISDLDKYLYEVEKYKKEALDFLGGNDLKVAKGQEIVLCGSIGLAGTMLISKYNREALSKHFSEWFVDSVKKLEEQASIYPDLNLLKECSISEVIAVGEGGILKELFEMGSKSGLGFKIDFERISVRQATIEFCEYYDLNPYQLLSGGCTLIVSDSGKNVLRALEPVIPCGIIGRVTEDRAMRLYYRGEESLVNHPKPDDLLKILKEKIA